MSPSSTPDTIVPAVDLSTFSDRELLEAVYVQNANLQAQYVRVEAYMMDVLKNVQPMLETASRSPILKMMGLKL